MIRCGGGEAWMTGISRALCLAGGAAALVSTLVAFQMPFREYPGIEYNDFPLPSDACDEGGVHVRAPDVSADGRALADSMPAPSAAEAAIGSMAIPCGPRITRGRIVIFFWRCAG